MTDVPIQPSCAGAADVSSAPVPGSPREEEILGTLRRLLASELPTNETLYAICEALRLAPGLDGPETAVPGPRLQRLGCLPAVSFTDELGRPHLLSTFSRSTVLLPVTRRDLVIEVESDGTIRLWFELACTRADLERFARQERMDHFLVYVAAGDAGTLALARSLFSGAWPADVALPPEGGWHPRPGVTPVVPSSALPGGPASGPHVLLELEAAVYAGRFFALPLSGLLAHATEVAQGLRVEFRVRACESARLLADELRGKLLLNHVLFTSRVCALAEADRPLDGSLELALDVSGVSPSDRPILLEVLDWKTGLTFVVAEWATGCDPTGIVTLVNHGEGWKLRFPPSAGVVWPRALFLVPTKSPIGHVIPGTSGTLRGTAARSPLSFVVRAAHVDVSVGAAQRIAAWLAAGPGSLPHGQAVTPDEVRRLVARELPPPLRHALGGEPHAPERMTVDLQLRATDGPDRSTARRYVRPTCVVTLRLSDDAPVRELEPHARWLERVVAERMLVGVGLEIVLTLGGGPPAP
jgi:hypothetical protein